jgi:hypothetical protein
VVVFRDRVEAAWKSVVVFVIVSSDGKQMNSVEDLDVFKLAHQLALKAYSATKASHARSSRSNRSIPRIESGVRSSRLADWRHLTRKNEKSDF